MLLVDRSAELFDGLFFLREPDRIVFRTRCLTYLKEDLTLSYRKRIMVGMETMMKHVEKARPKAKAAWDAFVEQVRGPLDNVERAP